MTAQARKDLTGKSRNKNKNRSRSQRRRHQEKKTRSDIVSFLNQFDVGEYLERARRLDRRFILHIGPTNSGKTYDALQALQRDAVAFPHIALQICITGLQPRDRVGEVIGPDAVLKAVFP